MEPSPLLVAAIIAGGFALVLQLADAVTGTIEARSVLDEDDLDQITRHRARDLTWSIAFTALLAVLVAYCVDAIVAGAAAVGDPSTTRSLGATLLLLGLVALATFAVGMIGAVAAVRRERPSYARIRRDLRDRVSLAMERDELAAFRARLARADRMRDRPLRGSNVLRVIGLLLVLGIANTVLITAVTPGNAVAIVLSIAAIALSVAAFVVGWRAGEVRAAAQEAVLEAQREEVAALLERASIPQRGAVPGLRDRVSRALAILREQQR